MTDDDLFSKAADGGLEPLESAGFAERLRTDPAFARAWLRFARDEATFYEAAPALRLAKTSRAIARNGKAGRSFRLPALGQKAPLPNSRQLPPRWRSWLWLALGAAVILTAFLAANRPKKPAPLRFKIAAMDGSVEALSAGAHGPVRKGEWLPVGAMATTDAGSSLRLEESGGIALELASEASLDTSPGDPKTSARQIRLEKGRLKVRIPPGAPPFTVLTSNAETVCADGEFTISAGVTMTDLFVSRGHVRAIRANPRAEGDVPERHTLRVVAFGGLRAEALSKPPRQAQSLLWQIGRDDLSRDEFGDATPPEYQIPADWRQRVSWRGFGWRLNAAQPACVLRFELPAVPRFGAEFSFRTLNTAPASGGIPAGLAVFANGLLAGLPQTWKAAAMANDQVEFRAVDRIYIPPELLRAGVNELALLLPPHPYSESLEKLEVEWDYLALAELLAPADEPIHGRYVTFGSYADHAADQFVIDADLVRHMPALLKWMGAAYTGASMRVCFWPGPADRQPARREYLETLRDLGMGAVLSAPASRDFLSDLYARYGPLFQYHEIANSPEVIGEHTLQEMLDAAHLAVSLRSEIPAARHLRIVGPGWSFRKWGADPAGRRQIEDLCDAVNGHDFGDSYAFEFGGHFTGTLRAFGGAVNDGAPREWLSTECGTENGNFSSEAFIPTDVKRSSSFDRNFRAHVAVTDRIMQHAMFLVSTTRTANCSLFAPIADWKTHDPLDTEADEPLDHGGTRLQIFRRLTLAYGTHGRPLRYIIENATENRLRAVYFRAVDASALAPLAGSGAHSRKVLLSFVNFENQPSRLRVKVTFPAPGRYRGERIGPEARCGDAEQPVEIAAGPEAEFDVPLEPLNAVEYILEANSAPENQAP